MIVFDVNTTLFWKINKYPNYKKQLIIAQQEVMTRQL